jgi:hypothetical protein
LLSQPGPSNVPGGWIDSPERAPTVDLSSPPWETLQLAPVPRRQFVGLRFCSLSPRRTEETAGESGGIPGSPRTPTSENLDPFRSADKAFDALLEQWYLDHPEDQSDNNPLESTSSDKQEVEEQLQDSKESSSEHTSDSEDNPQGQGNEPPAPGPSAGHSMSAPAQPPQPSIEKAFQDIDKLSPDGKDWHCAERHP